MKLLELGIYLTLSWGVAAVSCHLFALADALVLNCMTIRSLAPPSNEPSRLTYTGLALDEIRAEE